MGEVVEFEVPTNNKFEEFKRKAKERCNAAYSWCKEHKEVVLAIVPVLISGGFELAKTSMKYRDKAEERKLEEEKLASVYDRSAGMYLSTRRQLNNSDYRRIQELKRQGYTTGEALDRLGLLD